MEEVKNGNKVLDVKREEKRPFGRLRPKLKYKFKVDLKEVKYNVCAADRSDLRWGQIHAPAALSPGTEPLIPIG